MSHCECSRSTTRWKSRNLLQCITISANYGRLHNQGFAFSGCTLLIRACHVRGNRNSSIIISSSVNLPWRLPPQFVIFVCTLPWEPSYPASTMLPRWLPHIGFLRVQPVCCPTLLPGIFATWRPSGLQESEGDEEVLHSWTYLPRPKTFWIEQAPDPRLPSTNDRRTTSSRPSFLMGLARKMA